MKFPRNTTVFFDLFKNGLLHLAIFCLVFTPTLALADNPLPITPDGSTNTKIISAPNGTTVVNIAAPVNGKSENNFLDYNVNPSGLILNNATGHNGGAVSTQLGGIILDNPHLENSGSARTILNRVTSTRISELRGYTEVAGDPADVIVENNNGIYINGAGFINASRLTMVVGNTIQNPNDLIFKLASPTNLPKLVIDGNGFDLEKVPYTDLVASTMQLLAPIYGGNNEVNLRLGDNEFNYTTKEVTSSPNNNPAPDSIAIDASVAGKIEAKKIYIIATKEGFGVKLSGDLIAYRGGINVDVKGNLTFNNVLSEDGDVNINARNGSIANNGVIQTKGVSNNIILNAAENITNSSTGQILSAGNINLTSKSLINSKNIVANNITISADQITNNDNILAATKLTINANDYLTNNQDLTSNDIEISAKTLNNNKNITANNNAVINAATLNNNTSNNSQIKSIKNLTLNTNSLNNTSGKINSGGILQLRNLTLTSPNLATLFSASATSTNALNDGGAIFAALSIDFNLGSGSDYTMTGTVNTTGHIDITANNIINQGNVSATDYINLNASNNFTNGYDPASNNNANTLNQNVKLVSGTYLDVLAGNSINNYGALSAATNLTLTATNGDINNFGSNAKIIGGTRTETTPGSGIWNMSGIVTLNALNGSINNQMVYINGLLQNYNFSDGTNGTETTNDQKQASISITDSNSNSISSFFDNSGNLKTGTDYQNLLTKTSVKLLVNGNYKYVSIDPLNLNLQTQLQELYSINNSSAGNIVSNNDIFFNAKNLNNYGRIDVANYLTTNLTTDLNNNANSMIYSGGNMTLNVANNLTNYFADIFAMNDVTIKHDQNSATNKANKLNNISGNIIAYLGNMTIRVNELNNKRGYMKTQGADFVYARPHVRDDCHRDWKGKQHCSAVYEDRWGADINGAVSEKSSIQSKGILTIDVGGSFLNDASDIIANGNITINANTFNNHSYDFRSYRQDQYDNHEYQNSSIKSVGSITVTAPNDISNTTTYPNTNIDALTNKSSQLVNSLDVNAILDTGIVPIDISGYLSGPDNQGLFKKSNNPNRPYLETRSEFIDLTQFLGSDYWFTAMGVDKRSFLLATSGRMFGDAFVEDKLIQSTLLKLRKDSVFLSDNGSNSNTEIKTLFDNSAQEIGRLHLDLTTIMKNGLTQDQINSLNKDIVLFQGQNIDGIITFAPTVYLSLATRTKLTTGYNTTTSSLSNGALATNSVIYSTGALTLNSSNGSITNSGSIISGDNINITASNFTNKTTVNNASPAEITTTNKSSSTSGNISIATTGDIKNIGANITSTNALNLTSTNGNIINTSVVSTNDANLLNSSSDSYISNGQAARTDSGNISSTLLSNASLKGGSITINAANDFTNSAASMNATSTTFADNSTTTGNLVATAGDDITLGTLQLRNRTESSWGNKKKGGTSITDTTTNLASNVNSQGNITLTTTGLGTNNEKATVDQKFQTAQTKYNADLVTYNQAVADYPSKLAAYNDALAVYNAAISAGGFKARFATPPTPPTVPVAPTAPVYSQIMASIDNGGSDIKISGSNISTTTNGSNITINANDSVNITSAQNSSYKMETSHKKGTIVEKSSVAVNSGVTNVSSSITSLGNVEITSGLDTNIIASNISGSGSGSIVSGGNTNVFNAVDTSYSYSNSTSTRNGLLRQIPGAALLISTMSAIMSVDLSTINGLSGGNLETMQRAGGIDYHKSNLTGSSTTETLVASNLNFGNSLTINSNVDLTVKASNLKTTSGDITLAANGDVNILSAAATSTTDRSYRDKSDRAKQNGSTETTNITNISSTVTSGSNLNIISGNNTTIQSSKLSSAGDLTVNAGNNLLLLTASDASIKSDENKGKTTYTFSNGTSGYVSAKAVNNEITSNTNSVNQNSNLNLNATNSIVVQYRAGTIENVVSGANSNNQQLAYLKTLNDLSKTNPDKITFDPVADVMKNWDQTNRGLTEVGTAVIVIAAIAATVVTAGAMAPALAAAAAAGTVTVGTTAFVVGTAVASSAMATASVSATNASMNTDSSLFGSTKVITRTTWKDTTSTQSIQNMTIAGITAGVTFGAGSLFSNTTTTASAGSSAGSTVGGGSGAVSSTGAAANTSTTLYVSPNLSNTTVLTTSTTNSSSLLTNLGSATRTVGIATATNIAATSLVKGQSINQVIAEQGGLNKVLTNSALQVVAQVGAMQIGNAAHGSLTHNADGTITYNAPTISQGQQLALHAALGCGIGAGMSGGESGCAGGAVSGVVGELTGKFASNAGLNNSQAVVLAGAAGGLSSIFTGSLTGADDHKIAQNVYMGQMLGSNAAQNNFIRGKMMDEEFRNMWLDGKITDSQYQQYQQVRNQGDRIAGTVALAGVTLGAGSLAIQGSAAAGEGLLAAKLAGATVNGIAGASGGAWGAYVGGGNTEQILKYGTTAGLISAGTGFFFGGSGLVNGVTTGASSGTLFSAVNTYQTNPNATAIQYLNNGLEGFLGGALVGYTGAAFTPANSGLAGQIIGAQTALPVDMFLGVISNKYDLLPTPRAVNNNSNR